LKQKPFAKPLLASLACAVITWERARGCPVVLIKMRNTGWATSLKNKPFKEIWKQPEYIDFRQEDFKRAGERN